MDMRAHERARSLRAIDEAVLRLHAPGLSAAEITALLPEIVRELNLASAAAYEPVSGRRPPRQNFQRGEFEVRRPDGTLEGVLVCQPHNERAARLLFIVSAHTGVALAARHYMSELESAERRTRQVAERLQDSLLPAVPELDNTTIEVQYRAAAREARVGGDFYDVFVLPDGKVLLVVGDVVGKGVAAATRTTLITQTLRALAMQKLDLDDLLERVDEQVTFQDPELSATIWCGLYEPSTGEIAFSSLGHPPALLLRADGESVHLSLQGLPLGYRDLIPDRPEIRSRLLAPRDLLVLYSDGVVEASGDLIAGQAALLDAVERRREEPLSQLVGGVLDELLADAGHLDDAVMLLLRRR